MRPPTKILCAAYAALYFNFQVKRLCERSPCISKGVANAVFKYIAISFEIYPQVIFIHSVKFNFLYKFNFRLFLSFIYSLLLCLITTKRAVYDDQTGGLDVTKRAAYNDQTGGDKTCLSTKVFIGVLNFIFWNKTT